MKRIPLVLAGLALVAPAIAHAAGLAVSDVDAMKTGRGYAAMNSTDSASAVFYNPANMTRMEGLNLNLGITAVMPRWTFTPAAEGSESTTSDFNVATPPAAFVTYNLGKISDDVVAFGLGFYVPYGNAFTWEEGWAGADEVEELALTVFELSPVIAVQPADWFSFGVGLRYLPSSVYMKREIPMPTGAPGSIEMGGNGDGWGGTAAVSLWPIENLSIAVTWRTPVTLKLEGKSDLSLEPPFDTEAIDRDMEAELPLGHNLRFGLGYDLLGKKLRVAADAEYVMGEAYKELVITFINEDGTRTSVADPRNTENCWTLHFGADYDLMDNLTVRAGYIYDQKTLPENTVNPAPPESNVHVITLGASYFLNDWLGVHVHFLNAFFSKRETLTSALPGTYEGGHPAGTFAYSVGLSLSAKFDVAPVLGGTKTASTAAPAKGSEG